MNCNDCSHRAILYCHHPSLPKKYYSKCLPSEGIPKWCPDTDLRDLNKWLDENRPGYKVRNFKNQYELLGPDDLVHYRRDNFVQINRVARG
jgi:hypothetical protein